MKQQFLIATFLLSTFLNYAQERTVFIFHNTKGFPIPGVSVTVDASNWNVVSNQTDADGRIEFANIPLGTQCILHASHISMKQLDTSIVIAQSVYTFELQESDLFLETLEIKAVRASDKSPFAKTSLSRASIEKLNLGADIPFVLNQTPSVTINSDAGNGVGYTAIRIRGTDATRINVTLNGIPYNDAESQGTFLVNIPDIISSASSVQIQRGVGTSTNGAGAFGATINLATNEFNEQGYIALNNTIGSFNTYKNTLLASSGLIDSQFTVDARLSRISSDGYVDRARSDLYAWYISGAWINKKSSLRLNVFSGNEETYQSWYGITKSVLDTNRTFNPAGTEKAGDPYNDQTDNYKQTHYQLFFNHRFTDRLSMQLTSFLTRGKGYYNEYRADVKLKDYGLENPVVGADTIYRSNLIRQLWLDNYFFGNVFTLQYNTTKTNYTIGGSWSRYNGKHFGLVKSVDALPTIADEEYYRHPSFKNDANAYIKALHHLSNQWILFADLQYRTVLHQMDGFRGNGDLFIRRKFDFFNPKVGVSYSKNGWSVFASYALAGKEPNRDDFEAGTTQQPNAEYLHDIEFGIDKRSNNWNTGINFYGMFYKDQLVQTGRINDVGAYTRINVPNSYRIGMEWQGALRISKWMNAATNFTLSSNKIKSYTEYADNYDVNFEYIDQKAITHSNTAISFSPSIIAAGTINFLPSKNTELSILSKYVGKQYLDNTENEERSLDAYFTNDLRFTLDVFSNKWKGSKFIVQANNVFNVMYEPNGYVYAYLYDGVVTSENYYYPMAGINFMVALNIRLGR